jgi:type IV pilus assembly protein PilV
MSELITFKDGSRKMVKGQKGFTLVEVMVALGILAFGILAVASMQSAALLGTSKSNAVTQATTVGMDRMERLLALPFSPTWDATPQNGDDTSAYFSGLPALPADVTSVTWEVTPGMAPVQNTTRLITVTVGFRGLRNDIVLSSVKTLIEGQ